MSAECRFNLDHRVDSDPMQITVSDTEGDCQGRRVIPTQPAGYPYLFFEIWDAIFKEVLASNSKARATLASVCRDWHTFAYTVMHLRQPPMEGHRPLIQCLSLLRVLHFDPNVPRSALQLFNKCSELRKLTLLSHATPTDQPLSLTPFVQLQELTLRINSLSEVQALEPLSSLEKLELQTSGEEELSLASLTTFTALHTLAINQLSRDFFPAQGPRLPNLRALRVSLRDPINDDVFHEMMRRAIDIHKVKSIAINPEADLEDIDDFSPTLQEPWSWPIESFTRVLSTDFRCAGNTLLEILLYNLDHNTHANMKEYLRSALYAENDVNRLVGPEKGEKAPIWYFLLFDHLDLLQELVKRQLVNIKATNQSNESALYYIIEEYGNHSFPSFCASLDFLLAQGLTLDEDVTLCRALVLVDADAQCIQALINRGAPFNSISTDRILSLLGIRLALVDTRRLGDLYQIASLFKLHGLDLSTVKDGQGKNLFDSFLRYSLDASSDLFSDTDKVMRISEFIHALNIKALHVETCEAVLQYVTKKLLIGGDEEVRSLNNLVAMLHRNGFEFHTNGYQFGMRASDTTFSTVSPS